VVSESQGKELSHGEYQYVHPISDIGECPPESDKVRDSSGRLYGCGYTYKNTLTNMYAQPGSSGSPVVNQDGLLVGVVQSYHPREGAGLVPQEYVVRLLEKF
jgi:hypothetical protein